MSSLTGTPDKSATPKTASANHAAVGKQLAINNWPWALAMISERSNAEPYWRPDPLKWAVRNYTGLLLTDGSVAIPHLGSPDPYFTGPHCAHAIPQWTLTETQRASPVPPGKVRSTVLRLRPVSNFGFIGCRADKAISLDSNFYITNSSYKNPF